MSNWCNKIIKILCGYDIEAEQDKKDYKEISDLINREYPYLSEQDQLIYKTQLFQKKKLMARYKIY